MNFSPANVLSGSFALLLHGAVIGAFMVDWEPEEAAAVTSDKKYFIPAKIYAENPHTARQEKQAKAIQTKQRKERQRQENLKRQQDIARQKLLDEQKVKELADQKEADRLRQLRAQQLAAEKLAADEANRLQKEADEANRLAQIDDELQRLINDELDAIAAVTDDEKAMAYVGQIQADIIQNWSRPPSARNGMQTLLKVYLVPTGEVVDVSVLTSSGNDAFDRSAIQAVRKVRRFEVPGDARLFEEKFREFEVLFRPEDLRF